MSETLRELAKPFPDRFVHKNPSGGGSYIKHHVVEQRMIQVLGYPPTFTLVEVVKGSVPPIPPNPNGKSNRAREGRDALHDVAVGVIARMEVTIDGRPITVEEAGDCEQPHNWDTDGQRLKDAMSDAYKRCAMRLGVGLHLWSQDEFFLYDVLGEDGSSVRGEGSASEPHVTSSPVSSPEPEPASPHAASPGSGEPPWYSAAVKAHGAQTVKDIASSFSKSGAKVTKLEQLDAATEEQRSEVLQALADLDWNAPAKAGAK